MSKVEESGEVQSYESAREALDKVCTQAHQQLLKASEALAEDVENANSRKRVAKVLDDGMLLFEEMRKKHCLPAPPAPEPSSSSAAPTSPPSSSPAEHDLHSSVQHKNANWHFIDTWRASSEEMDWTLCFKVGKALGLFLTYKSEKSLKSAYFRSKSKAQ